MPVASTASGEQPLIRPDRPIRVAVLTERCGMAGGCERFVHETSSRIAAMPGFSIDIFANRWEQTDPRIRYRRVPLVRFPKFIKPWAFVRAAQRMIQRGGYDVVHAHVRNDFAHVTTVHPAPHRFWLSEVLRKRRPSLHDRMMIAMERRMVETGSDRVFHPVSQMLLDIWLKEYGDLPGRWEVQSPGVDTKRFAPNPALRTSMRRELGISEQEFVLLFVGMNFEVKGLQRILEAVSRCRSKDSSYRARLVVVGRGDRVSYVRVAERLGIAEWVTFLGIETSRLQDIYAAADVFVMPSEFETYCMAVHESMSAGIPAIVSDRMGIATLVSSSDAGIVVRGGHDDLPDALLAARDGIWRTSAGANARAAALHTCWEAASLAIAHGYRQAAFAHPLQHA